MSDLYQKLGVDRNASQDEIKKAYRKLARQMHPDVNPDLEVQNRFKEITAAYEILSDPEKRNSYDHGGNGYGNGYGNGTGFGGFSDIMDAFFGGGGSRGPRPRMRQGQDALIKISISLEEACFGVRRDINLETAIICDKCGGDGCAPGSSPRSCEVCKGRGEIQQVTRSFIGQVLTSRPCATCQGFGTTIPDPCGECAGDGRVRAKRNLEVNIPAGIDSGNRIQLSGQGEVGPGGGPAGDLYLEVRVEDHEYLIRSGDDLHLNLNVPMIASALGTSALIQTFDGEEEVAIKAGTQPDSVITIKGKGMAKLRTGGRGDLHVHIRVEVPTKLSKNERELLQSLSQLRQESPRVLKEPLENEGGFFGKFRETFRS